MGAKGIIAGGHAELSDGWAGMASFCSSASHHKVDVSFPEEGVTLSILFRGPSPSSRSLVSLNNFKVRLTHSNKSSSSMSGFDV